MQLLKIYLAVATLALCFVLTVSAQQDPDFKITVDAKSVSVSVNVADAAGRPVIKLKQDDFSVYEDGVLQPIQTFESVETPFNILILVDCSGSTQADWGLMGNAIDRFASMLRPRDRISVAQFGNGVDPIMSWQARTGDSLGVNIRPTSQTCAGTDFYGALETAIGKFKGISGRKGVVALTDGVQVPFPMKNMVIEGQRLERVSDSVEDRNFQKALKAVAQSDVVFYFVAVNTDLNPDPVVRGYSQGGMGMRGFGVPAAGPQTAGPQVTYDPTHIYDMQQARTRMQQVADITGGRVAFPKKPSDVAPLYEDIGREFGNSYGIWYSPIKPLDPDDTTPRKIEIRVKGVGMTVTQSKTTYTPSSR